AGGDYRRDRWVLARPRRCLNNALRRGRPEAVAEDGVAEVLEVDRAAQELAAAEDRPVGGVVAQRAAAAQNRWSAAPLADVGQDGALTFADQAGQPLVVRFVTLGSHVGIDDQVPALTRKRRGKFSWVGN